jgi:amidophosphoribosyltransferase
MSTRKELVASDLSVDEVREFIGADSLAYLSLDALVEATGSEDGQFCRACFDGQYPVPIPEDVPTKLVLEQPVSPTK